MRHIAKSKINLKLWVDEISHFHMSRSLFSVDNEKGRFVSKCEDLAIKYEEREDYLFCCGASLKSSGFG